MTTALETLKKEANEIISEAKWMKVYCKDTDDIFQIDDIEDTVAMIEEALERVKKALEDLKTVDLSSLDKILEAEEALENVDLSALYSYDKAYLNPIYQEVKGRIDAAITDIGLGYRVVSYERALESFEALVNATEFNSAEAISSYNKIVAIKEEIAAGVDTLEGTLRDRFNAANDKFATTYTERLF